MVSFCPDGERRPHHSAVQMEDCYFQHPFHTKKRGKIAKWSFELPAPWSSRRVRLAQIRAHRFQRGAHISCRATVVASETVRMPNHLLRDEARSAWAEPKSFVSACYARSPLWSEQRRCPAPYCQLILSIMWWLSRVFISTKWATPRCRRPRSESFTARQGVSTLWPHAPSSAKRHQFRFAAHASST